MTSGCAGNRTTTDRSTRVAIPAQASDITDGNTENNNDGTFTYASSGDPTSDDDISKTTFARKITVTYSATGQASVQGDTNGYATVNGNKVTVRNTGNEIIVYELKGTTSDGCFKLYSTKKQAILLNGVSITNKSGAAINNQSGKRTFVMVEGDNHLADGPLYTDTPDGEDEKAAFFSEGQLLISGSGTLTVTASGKSGIVSDDYVRVMNSPILNVTSTAGHGIRGKEAIQVDAGTITANVSAAMKKGFTSDSMVLFNGGITSITVTGGTDCDNDTQVYSGSAGIKADKLFIMNDGTLNITNSGAGGKGISIGIEDENATPAAYFNGGTVTVAVSGRKSNSVSAKGIKVGNKFLNADYNGFFRSAQAYRYTGTLRFDGSTVMVSAAGDEAIECKGTIEITDGDVYAYSSADDAINSSSTFTISGGYIAGISTANDGLDANGYMNISGGVVMAASHGGPECGIDVNSEDRFYLTFTGGTLFVQGGIEHGSRLNQDCYSTTVKTGIWYGMTVGNTTYCFKTATTSGTPLVVSASSEPVLLSEVECTGGTSRLNGQCYVGCSIIGGNSVTLTSYTGNMGGPMGRPMEGGFPGGFPPEGFPEGGFPGGFPPERFPEGGFPEGFPPEGFPEGRIPGGGAPDQSVPDIS